MKKKIYVYGNPLVAEDTLAFIVANKLKKEFPDIAFVHLDPNEEIKEKEIMLLDVAEGINKVTILHDVDKLETGKKVSPHDYDAAFSLQLMKKIGLIEKVTIIAIPINYSLEKACKEVEHYIHLILKK